MTKEFAALQIWFMNHMNRKVSKKGQSLAEYGLILALVAVLCITALTTMGGNISKMINQLGNKIQTVTDGMK